MRTCIEDRCISAADRTRDLIQSRPTPNSGPIQHKNGKAARGTDIQSCRLARHVGGAGSGRGNRQGTVGTQDPQSCCRWPLAISGSAEYARSHGGDCGGTVADGTVGRCQNDGGGACSGPCGYQNTQLSICAGQNSCKAADTQAVDDGDSIWPRQGCQRKACA